MERNDSRKENILKKEISKKEMARKDKKGREKEDKTDQMTDTEKDKEISLLSDTLEEKTKEAASHYEQLLRVRAEFENFKKRQAKEHAQYLKYSNEGLIKELIPVLNNLERASEAAKTNKDVEALQLGVEMILNMFYEALKKVGVEPIHSAGQSFDPSRHEVVTCLESGEHEENTVIQEFEKGYFLYDRLLYPAKVVVSKKPSDNGEGSPPNNSTFQKE